MVIFPLETIQSKLIKVISDDINNAFDELKNTNFFSQDPGIVNQRHY